MESTVANLNYLVRAELSITLRILGLRDMNDSMEANAACLNSNGMMSSVELIIDHSSEQDPGYEKLLRLRRCITDDMSSAGFRSLIDRFY